MSTPKWEVVTKTQRKSKIPQHVSQKNKKKLDPSSMPRIEPSEPVKESPTIYDAFMEKQPNHTQAASSKDTMKKPVEGNGAPPQRKSATIKKKPSDKKPEKISLEDVIDEITYDDVEAFIVNEQATFPDNPPIWLMDIASMLNLKLQMAEDSDPILQGKPPGYPLCVLPSNIKSVIGETMLQCSQAKLGQCFNHMVNDMISDLAKGKSIHGFRMLIQLASELSPSVVLDNFPQELIKSSQNRQFRCLAVMWSVGQVGFKDLSDGLKVWFELMLPFLNVRNLASYIIENLEALFNCPDNKSSEGGISEKYFFQLFDLMHNLQHLSLPGPLQRKLQSVYPKVRALALKPGQAGMSRIIFPSFLKRCNEGIKESLRKEILECLVICLKEDKSNFGHWRQVYTKYLPASGILLHHLNDNWNTVGSKLDRKLLKETVTAFNLTNEDLLKKGKNDIDCDLACKELSARVATRRFSWFWLMVVLFSVALGILAYDIYLHNGFQKSKTRQVLNDIGMLTYLQHAWNTTEYYLGIAMVWLSDNVPYYYGKMCEVVSPYLTLFWEKLYAFGEFLAEVTEPTRLWLSKEVPLLLEWIDEKLPWLWESVSHYGGIVWGVIVKGTLSAWSFVSYYTFHAGVWLQENIFRGKLSPADVQESVVSGARSLWIVIQYSAIKVGSLIRNTTAELLW